MSPPPTIMFVALSLLCVWQFAVQVTYVNTAAPTFHALLSRYSVYDHAAHLPAKATVPFTTALWSFEWGVIVSSFYVGAFIGFALVSTLISRMGTRRVLLLGAVPALGGILLGLLLPTLCHVMDNRQRHATELLIMSRILIGIHCGVCIVALPVHIQQAARREEHGRLAAMQQVAQAVGDVSGFLIGTQTIFGEEHHFMWTQACTLVPVLLLVALLCHLPDTANFLLIHEDRLEDARHSILFYQTHADVEQHVMLVMQEASAHKTAFSWKYVTMGRVLYSRRASLESRAIVRGVLIGLVVALAYSFSADDIYDSFSVIMIESLADNSTSTNWTNLVPEDQTASGLAHGFAYVCAAVLFVASVIGTQLVDRVGRRKPIILGIVGTAVGNAFVVLGGAAMPAALIVPVTMAGILVVKVSVGMGSGAAAWFTASEITPTHVKARAQSVASGSLLLTNAIITSLFLPLTRAFGVLAVPLVTSLPALACAFLVYRHLPETMNVDTRVVQRQLVYGRRRRPLGDEAAAGVENPNYAGYGALNGGGGKRESLMAFNWSDTDSAASQDDQTTRLLF